MINKEDEDYLTIRVGSTKIRLDIVEDIILSPDFWDCECKYSYIHKKSKELYCKKCKFKEREMPDSRLDEIIREYSRGGLEL